MTAGQTLIELDPTTDAAEEQRVSRDLEQAKLDVNQYFAEGGTAAAT